MAGVTSTSVIRHIESLFDGRSVAGLTDRQLLERFTAGPSAGGEEAFAAVLQRHGPMVLGLCRQFLLDEHHAEDAFQAVFLVLAHKAASIREPELLGNWLYGVVLRVARNARRRLAHRRRIEAASAMRRPGPGSGLYDKVEFAETPAEETSLAREQAEALHAEIDRLPKLFQLPIVLCYFEGLTLDEASRRLQWPLGTVSSRLARAREKLRRGLARRGVMSAGALSAVMGLRLTSASVSEPLGEITARAASDFAAGRATGPVLSAVASALARELVRSMFVRQLRFLLGTVLIFTAIAAGVGLLSQSFLRKAERANPPVARRLAATSGQTAESPAPARMIVVGRVLDSKGEPVAHATVELVGRPRRVFTRGNWNGSHVLIGRGDTDSGGRFRLDALRTSSVRFDALYALVKSPVAGWADVDLDAQQPAVEIRLRSEQVIRGRLVDVNGQAIPGVELRVLGFGPGGGASRNAHVDLVDPPPEALRAWPDPVKTDDQGRFVLRGLGHGLYVPLVVDDPRFGVQVLELTSDDRKGPLDVTLTLKPAKSIEGRVIAADTGQPVPGTLISANSVLARADADGRYRAISAGDLFNVNVYPPVGKPYLIADVDVAWNKGMVHQHLDIALRRGVLIHGKVTEQGTGRPLEGSSVLFVPVNGPAGVESKWISTVPSQSDGSFRIVVPQGKGHLLVFGPTSDYIHTVIGSRTLLNGQTGGERWYAHRIIPYEVKDGESPRALNAELRRGKTIRGRLVDALGRPVVDAVIITRLHIEPVNPFWRGEWSEQHRARDGHFEVHGLDPKSPVLSYFLDAEHELGAAVELAGEQSDKELTIRLEPAGQAKARFVRPDGRPFANFFPQLQLVATPGPPAFRRNENDPPGLADDAVNVMAIDRKHYVQRRQPLSAADGRITLPALIPGALYRLSVNGGNGRPFHKDFSVKSGESIDLGDISVVP
jgi:RNA polymerase sigma factor (sigma-70 family)